MSAMTRRALSGLTAAVLVPGPVDARQSPDSPDDFLLTVFFLRHDQSKMLDEINEHLRQTGFVRQFPPPGIDVVSWYVLMASP